MANVGPLCLSWHFQQINDLIFEGLVVVVVLLLLLAVGVAIAVVVVLVAIVVAVGVMLSVVGLAILPTCTFSLQNSEGKGLAGPAAGTSCRPRHLHPPDWLPCSSLTYHGSSWPGIPLRLVHTLAIRSRILH